MRYRCLSECQQGGPPGIHMLLSVGESGIPLQGRLRAITYALMTNPGRNNRRCLGASAVAGIISALTMIALLAMVSLPIHGKQHKTLHTVTPSNAIVAAAKLKGHHIQSMHPHPVVLLYMCLDWTNILIHSKPCDPYISEQKWTITQGTLRQVKTMKNVCLDGGGAHVHVWACNKTEIKQQWNFDEAQGTIKKGKDWCLRASPKQGIVQVVRCNPVDKFQQFKFKLPAELTTTKVPTTKTKALTTEAPTASAAATKETVPGATKTQPKDDTSDTDGEKEGDDTVELKEVKDNNAYCWLVMQSSGEEASLVRAHYVKGRSIFSCKGWSVFTDKDALAPVSAVTNIGSVRSKKGPWGFWYNTEVFLRAWDAVVAGGQYRRHPWTLKVDVDTVFFPGRLSAHVGSLNPNDPWFLNTDGMLSAPIEVFSRAAVRLYAAKGRHECSNAGARAGEEDSFLDYCMHTLGASPRADKHLLMSCGDPDRCRDRAFLAFHLFETPALYDDCDSAARGSKEEEQVKDEGFTGFCCLWGTDCYSCTASNRPSRSTWCGANPQQCNSCGQRSRWCQLPREPVQCRDRRVLTLYHQTSPHICDLIIQSNFLAGKVGWCGGGIYFAMDAQATNNKCIGPQSNKGCILQVRVDVGRTWFKGKTCNRSLLGKDVLAAGYDSVSFDPSDGQEYAIYQNRQVLSIRRYGWWLPDAQVREAHWDVPGR